MSRVLLCDRYEIGDVIGRGGMADVHEGTDARLQRDVAVKIVRSNGNSMPDAGARFDDEARVAARLQHPNVVAVYDTGTTDDDRAFIVMERLPGETLADRIRQGPMNEAQVRVIADDVLAALAAAHAAGVVHRDIKPGNILLTDDGHAKVADFGIARESETLLVDPTTTDALTGTPAYVAPERVVGEPATARSDIWALGVVLYEALAGRKPFEGTTPLATAMAVRDGGATPLAELRPDVDPAFAAVVTRALAADPADRYASATEMAAATRAGVDADATHVDQTMMLTAPVATAATPATTAGPALRPRVPGRVLALAAIALGVVLLLIGIGMAAGRDDTPRSETPATPAASETPTTAAPTTTTPTVTTTAPALQIQIGGAGAGGGNGGAAKPGKRGGKGKRG